jgi:hypothetical protein
MTGGGGVVDARPPRPLLPKVGVAHLRGGISESLEPAEHEEGREPPPPVENREPPPAENKEPPPARTMEECQRWSRETE